MIDHHGLIEYLLTPGGGLPDREGLTAQEVKRFTDEMRHRPCPLCQPGPPAHLWL